MKVFIFREDKKKMGANVLSPNSIGESLMYMAIKRDKAIDGMLSASITNLLKPFLRLTVTKSHTSP